MLSTVAIGSSLSRVNRKPADGIRAHAHAPKALDEGGRLPSRTQRTQGQRAEKGKIERPPLSPLWRIASQLNDIYTSDLTSSPYGQWRARVACINGPSPGGSACELRVARYSAISSLPK